MAIGKVIKSDGQPDPGQERGQARPRAGVLSAEAYEARQEGQAILAEAERRAAELLARARAEREAELEKARQEGFQQGLAQVAEELTRAKLQRAEILKGATQELLELSLKVAEKIIGRDLERDPAVLVQMCATAVEAARSARALTVRVHPSMGAMLRGAGSVFSEVLGKSVDVTLRDDPEVEPAGCVIQTEFGTIDAQLKTQLEMLKNVLLPDPGRSEGPA